MNGNSEKSFDIIALEKFMQEKGYSRKDLEEQLGTRARVSEVLAGKRSLSISMLKNLVNNWGMDANLLLRDPSLKSKPRKEEQTSAQTKDSIVWMLD